MSLECLEFLAAGNLMGMYKLIQQVIRFAAVLSLVQAASMAIGWVSYSNTALIVDFIAIVIWAWSEYDLRNPNKPSP